MEWRGEVLELIEINGDLYTWVDVRKIEDKEYARN